MALHIANNINFTKVPHSVIDTDMVIKILKTMHVQGKILYIMAS